MKRCNHTIDMFDSGDALKASGMAEVLAAEAEEWKSGYRFHAEQYFATLPKGAHFTGEAVNNVVRAAQGAPHHANVFSAMFSSVLRGWLKNDRVVATEEMHKARRRARHANMCRVYLKVK